MPTRSNFTCFLWILMTGASSRIGRGLLLDITNQNQEERSHKETQVQSKSELFSMFCIHSLQLNQSKFLIRGHYL